MFKKELALKEKVKLMIGLAGASGSGKTYSALQLAFGLTGDWNKIAFADTENKSSLYYAGEKTGPWQFINFPSTIKDGYHPSNWVNLIRWVESDSDIDVLILDSISPEWDGMGGSLDLVKNLSKNQRGNSFTPWNTVTPLHNSFVDKMRESRLHIIATMRVKTEYAMDKNEQGKTTPQKIGLKPIQRDGIEFEFGIMFDMLSDHHAATSKDRTGIFSGKAPFVITPEIGKELVAWANDGKEKPIFDKANEEDRKRLVNYLTLKKVAADTHPEIIEAMHGKEPIKQEIDEILKTKGIFQQASIVS